MSDPIPVDKIATAAPLHIQQFRDEIIKRKRVAEDLQESIARWLKREGKTDSFPSFRVGEAFHG